MVRIADPTAVPPSLNPSVSPSFFSVVNFSSETLLGIKPVALRGIPHPLLRKGWGTRRARSALVVAIAIGTL
jgi:hypothetical protein